MKAIVGFHPGLSTSPDSKHITGSVLMCVGTDDPFVPLDDQVAGLKALGAKYPMLGFLPA